MKYKDVAIAVDLTFYKVIFTKEIPYHSQLLLADNVNVLVCFQFYILCFQLHILFIKMQGFGALKSYILF